MPADPSLLDSVAALRVATLVVAALTAWRPAWGLALLLVALPAATHHPSARPTFWLVVLLATFELVYVLRARPSPRGAAAAIARQPLLLLSVLFAGAALLSLSSLPVLELWREHAAVARLEDPSAWPARLADVIRLPEARPEFPIVSSALTVQAVLLALIVWREARTSASTGVQLAVAVAVGLAAIVPLGLLEAVGRLDLSALRGTEFMINRTNTLQAASGNPGWFAEYVVYALPYGLALLAIGRSPRVGIAPMLGVLALAIIALAAAFQRGGWVSGAAVLAFVAWGSLRLLAHGREAHAAWHQRAVRVLIVTGVLLGVIGYGVRGWMALAAPDGNRPDAGAYLARLLSITDGNRLVYWRVGGEMLALHPVLGAGHESFALRNLMYYQSEGGALAGSPHRVPDAASAHSIYMQTATGTGMVGLAVLLALFATALWVVVSGVRAPRLDRPRLAVLLAGGGSLLGVAIYGLVQEVFYVHALRVLFFVGVGLVAAAAPAALVWHPRVARALGLGLALAFVAHLGYEYRWPGPNRLFASPHPTGVGGEEQGPSGETFQWTTIVATWPVPDGATTVSMRVRSVAPFMQSVEVTPCDGPPVRVALPDQTWRSLEAPLHGCGPGDRVWLRASPGWRPGGYGGLLGVMVSDVYVQ